MVGVFSASLRLTTSLRATSSSVAANFISSGIMGYFLFGEIVSVRWMVGVVAMLLGVVLIQPHSSAKMKEA